MKTASRTRVLSNGSTPIALASCKAIHALSAALLASAIMAGSAIAVPVGNLNVNTEDYVVTPGNDQFDNVFLQNGFEISGSPLSATGQYRLVAGRVSSNLTGTANLVKATASGVVFLTGTNSYTGTTTIEGGILSIGDSVSGDTGSIASASNITIESYGGLELYLADGSVFSNLVTVADTGTVTVLSSGTTTLSGTINGAGSFIQDGTGVTIMTGDNNYTGDTTVSNGTLRMGVSNAISSDSDLVVSGAGIVEIGVDQFQYVRSLSGDGTVLFKSEADDAGFSNLTVGEDTTDDSTFSGRLTGLGSFSKNGTGTLTLSGTSDMTGVIMIGEGTLKAGAGNIFSKNLNFYALGGDFDLNDFDQEIGDLIGVGSVKLGSADLTINNSRIISGSSIFGFSAVIGDMTGTGDLHKKGTGELFVLGNKSFTGVTYVHEGTVNLMEAPDLGGDSEAPPTSDTVGSIESVWVKGGQFRGDGEIRRNLINTGGVVAPGGSIMSLNDNPIGTLRVGGDFVQTSRGTTLIEITGRGAGEHDLLAVSGVAVLGGKLADEHLNGYKVKKGDKFTFLTATGGIEGKFTKERKALLHLAVGYGSNSVWLEGRQDKFTSVSGLNPNQKAVAKALDRAVSKDQLQRLTDRLVEAPIGSLPDTLTLLSPEQLAAVFTLGFASAQVQSTNIEHRLDDARRGSQGFSSNGLALTNSRGSVTMDGAPIARSGEAGLTLAGFDGKSLVGKETVVPVLTESRWSFFATGNGQWADIESTSEARGSEFTTGGVTVGGDYRVNDNLVVGIAGTYSNIGSDLSNGGSVSVNSGKGSIYGTFFNEDFYVNALLGGGYSGYDTERGGLGGLTKGSTNGGEFDALLGGGYDFRVGGFTVGPVASVQYTYLALESFEETGSNAVRLRFPSQHQESLKSALGVKASYAFNVGGIVITPEVRAQWQHEYLDSTAAIVSSFAGADSLFSVDGPNIGRDSLMVDAGATVQFNSSIAAFAYYTGELGRTNYSSNGVNGGVRISF